MTAVHGTDIKATEDEATAELLVEQTGAILRLSFNRPAKRNALNRAVRSALEAELRRAAADDTVRVVLLTGEGRDFSAGADIRELAVRTADDAAWPVSQPGITVESLGKPVIAELHGYALGGGMELALACTMRVGSTDLKWGFPELKLGVFPASGGTQRLPRMIGEARALDLILTGRQADADEALRLGVITSCVPPERLRAASMALAEQLAALSPFALRVATEGVRKSFDLSRQDGLDFERRIFGLLWAGDHASASTVGSWVREQDKAD